MTLRAVVVDDSVLFRRVISEALASLPDVEVVGTAGNGKLALQRVRELSPDLLTLDIEMPEMDGPAVLDALREAGEKVAVIVVSGVTPRGGRLTVKALTKGAFDVVPKPEGGSSQQARESLTRELGPRVKALVQRLEVRNILHRGAPAAPGPALRPMGSPTNRATLANVAQRMNHLAARSRPELVLIGVSTGGPAALARLLPAVPGDIGVPLLIVQHMPPVFTQSLAESLGLVCAVGVKEATAGEIPRPGVAYIAPGGRHMRLGRSPEGVGVIQITDDPPENNCRPAVDYLFRSVASNFPGKALAMVLTGMGSDGALGLRLLKRQGCFVIAQDEASSVVFGMPKAAIDAGVVDAVLPLDDIAQRMTQAVRGVR